MNIELPGRKLWARDMDGVSPTTLPFTRLFPHWVIENAMGVSMVSFSVMTNRPGSSKISHEKAQGPK